MRILKIEPTFGTAPSGLRNRAFFDIELSEDIRVYGCKLQQKPDGRFLSYPPSGRGARTMTFSPELSDKISALASRALTGGRAIAEAKINH